MPLRDSCESIEPRYITTLPGSPGDDNVPIRYASPIFLVHRFIATERKQFTTRANEGCASPSAICDGTALSLRLYQ